MTTDPNVEDSGIRGLLKSDACADEDEVDTGELEGAAINDRPPDTLFANGDVSDPPPPCAPCCSVVTSGFCHPHPVQKLFAGSNLTPQFPQNCSFLSATN